MKAFVLLTAALAAMAFGQDAKVDPKSTAPKVQTGLPQERPLTETEILRFQKALKDIAILREKFKIEEFSKAVEPFNQQQRTVWAGACTALGVPMAKIEAGECQLPQFLDANGELLKNPDGTMVVPKVIWKPTQEEPTTAKK